jgi:hypothetical protein
VDLDSTPHYTKKKLMHGEKRNAYRILVEKAEGNRPPGRSRRRWEDDIKIDLKELELDGMDWIYLA